MSCIGSIYKVYFFYPENSATYCSLLFLISYFPLSISATGLMFVPLNVELKYSLCAFPIIHIVSISRQLDHSCIKDRDGEIKVMQEEKGNCSA